MADVSLILFDLNGVLYRYDRAARIEALAAMSGRPAVAIEMGIWDSGFEDSGDAGAFDADTYLDGFGTSIGYRLSEAQWLTALQAGISPIPRSLALLPRIRRDVTCAVLTNNNLLVLRHFAVLYPEVAAAVGQRAYVSATFGARKPDPAVYRLCLDRLGVSPSTALFIDDSAANVAGAQLAGLGGYHLHTPADLEAALRQHGTLAP